MKELVVISGKGGTGKTSLTAAFASLAENSLLCDADVDAADLHLLLHPTIKERHPFIGGSKAIIRSEDCTQCGLCAQLCRFGAISSPPAISPLDCEGCGLCAALCPEKVIDFSPRQCGEWYLSDTRFGPFVHARLGIAEENSGKLVSLIRGQAREHAEQQGRQIILTDGPPGIGCPVIASISGADAVLIIAEPSLSGLHDMQRIVELTNHFNIPALLCINKFDLNLEISREIEQRAAHQGLSVVGCVPFDPAFTKAMVAGVTLGEHQGSAALFNIVKDIWQTITSSEAFCRTKTKDLVTISKF